MKIVHVILAASYREGFGYQENLLARKHKELGYDVSIITCDRYKTYRNLTPDERGIKRYVSPYGINVTVLPDNNNCLRRIPWFGMCFYKTKHLYSEIEQEKPDIIFAHGIQLADHEDIVRYKRKHSDVKVYIDNHNDYYNGPVNTMKEKFQRRVLGKTFVRDIARVSEKVWGVTPWRIDYLYDVYGLDSRNVDLLVMGGDEELIHRECRPEIRKKFITEHNMPEDSFIVITGGKIDKPKNTHLLIEAIERIDNPHLYLVVFGEYSHDMEHLKENKQPRIVNLGWIKADDVYDLFVLSDLAVFPGTHSVLWEQACASGIPGIFKDWDGGFAHVDVGGNCILLKEVTAKTLKQQIEYILDNPSVYEKMKSVAESVAMKEFSYKEIAKKSIEIKDAK